MWEFENNIYFIFPHKNAGIYLFIYLFFIYSLYLPSIYNSSNIELYEIGMKKVNSCFTFVKNEKLHLSLIHSFYCCLVKEGGALKVD